MTIAANGTFFAGGPVGSAVNVFGALAIAERIEDPDGAGVQERLHLLASVLEAQGSYEAALEQADRALEVSRSAFGPDHPQSGVSLRVIGGIRAASSDFAGAETAYAESLEIFEKSVGPQHVLYGDTLNLYAQVLRSTGKQAEAIAAEERLEELGFTRIGEEPSPGASREPSS